MALPSCQLAVQGVQEELVHLAQRLALRRLLLPPVDFLDVWGEGIHRLGRGLPHVPVRDLVVRDLRERRPQFVGVHPELEVAGVNLDRAVALRCPPVEDPVGAAPPHATPNPVDRRWLTGLKPLHPSPHPAHEGRQVHHRVGIGGGDIQLRDGLVESRLGDEGVQPPVITLLARRDELGGALRSLTRGDHGGVPASEERLRHLGDRHGERQRELLVGSRDEQPQVPRGLGISHGIRLEGRPLCVRRVALPEVGRDGMLLHGQLEALGRHRELHVEEAHGVDQEPDAPARADRGGSHLSSVDTGGDDHLVSNHLRAPARGTGRPDGLEVVEQADAQVEAEVVGVEVVDPPRGAMPAEKLAKGGQGRGSGNPMQLGARGSRPLKGDGLTVYGFHVQGEDRGRLGSCAGARRW
jgi:hypothetical protein